MAENDFVHNVISNTLSSPRSSRIGLTDQLLEGDFEWDNGEPLNFTNWAFGEPNNPAFPACHPIPNSICDENYATIYSSSGEWNDVPDKHYASYYCVLQIPCNLGPVSYSN